MVRLGVGVCIEKLGMNVGARYCDIMVEFLHYKKNMMSGCFLLKRAIIHGLQGKRNCALSCSH